nr:TRAP transporter small permease [uncultured Cohaesibacter sp.]
MKYIASLKWLEVLIAALLSVLVIIVFFNVLGRYILGEGFTWAEEAARFLFVWLTFIGAVIAYRKHAHIGMDLLTSIAPAKVRRILEALALGLSIIFLVVWGYSSFQLMMRSMSFLTPSLEIPRGWIYAIAPASAGLMLIIAGVRLVGLLLGRNANERERDDA